jgi:hypothetical protein
LCEKFVAHEVEFIIIGGFASIRFGVPRKTADLDLWVRISAVNADRILAALDEFGFGGLDITKADLLDPDMVIQLGRPPVRVDILTFATALDFDECYARAEAGLFGSVNVLYLAKADLLRNKKALGRPHDVLDVAEIGLLDATKPSQPGSEETLHNPKDAKRVREHTLKVYDSPEAADRANREENLQHTGVDRIRLLTAIVGYPPGRSESRLSRSYRIVNVPRS